MEPRVFLVPLTGLDSDDAALKAAAGAARRFGGHLRALFVHLDPRDAVPVVGDGVSGAIVSDIVHAAEQEADRNARAARAHFDRLVGKTGIPVAEQPPGPDVVSACFVEKVGRLDEEVARQSRLADMVVFARSMLNADIQGMVTLEAALIGGSRPLLLVPDALADTFGADVAIAWNGGPECARAVAGSLALLKAARSVSVLTAPTGGIEADVAEGLVDYLLWHGIRADRRVVTVRDGQSVGAALTDQVTGLGCDLLVMGGYGHSRVRELILGGVTRHVLTHDGPPVIMSH